LVVFLFACGPVDSRVVEGSTDVEGLEGRWFEAGYFQLWGRAEEDGSASRPDRNWVNGVVILYADAAAASDPGWERDHAPDFVGELWVAPPREEELSVFEFLARFGGSLVRSGEGALGAQFHLTGYELGCPGPLDFDGEVTSDRLGDGLLQYAFEGDLRLPEGLPSAAVAHPAVVSLRFGFLEKRQSGESGSETGGPEDVRERIERARGIRAVRPSTAFRELVALYSETGDLEVFEEILAGLPFAGTRAETVALDELENLRVSDESVLRPFLTSTRDFEVLYGLDLLMRTTQRRPEMLQSTSDRLSDTLRRLEDHDDPEIRQIAKFCLEGIPEPR
jgi:hypothetical protein